jgi:cytochrome c
MITTSQSLALPRLISSVLAAAVLAGMTALSPALAQEGNPEAGEDVFKKCRACHQIGDTGKNAVGPVLTGIIGRKSGTVEGFNYSEANKAAGEKGLVWTSEELFKYLEDPRAYMPGNKMAFAGIKDEQDRRDLIAYLAKFSKK